MIANHTVYMFLSWYKKHNVCVLFSKKTLHKMLDDFKSTCNMTVYTSFIVIVLIMCQEDDSTACDCDRLANQF